VNVAFNLTKPTESSLLPRIPLDAKIIAKKSKETIKVADLDKAIAKVNNAMEGETEKKIEPHRIMKEITASKNAFDHFSSEKKSEESPDGKYITSEQRCDMCMKKTLEVVVSDKPATETLASFLTAMCKKAEGARCELLQEKLLGHTMAHGKGKAMRLFCTKVHKVCRAFD
jgi:hypothetical protein